jgi:hypothetical protein
MKTKIVNKFGLMMAVAFALAFATVGANAAETDATKPERPAPSKATELKEIVKNFQDQKKQFLQQQKELKSDSRTKLREEVGSGGGVSGSVRDAKEAMAEAKRISREQARKLAEEAKEAAKEGRKRD